MSFSKQDLLEALMDTMPDFIYFKDLGGRFIQVNRSFLSYHAKELAEVVGKTDWDLFDPVLCRAAAEDERHILETGEPMVNKLEDEICCDGKIRRVINTKVPMRDGQGKIYGICGISRDVTREYQQQLALEASNIALAEKQDQMQKELILAQQIQISMLVQEYPLFSTGGQGGEVIDFAHRYFPHDSVGGDFFHIFQISESKVGILISDVMGHGVHAALVTVAIKLVVEQSHHKAHDPGTFLQRLNKQLLLTFEHLSQPIFVTAFYLILDLRTGEMSFANAGHPSPFCIEDGGEKVLPLESPERHRSFALAVSPDSLYVTHHGQLSEGGQLLFYTDGLSDFEWKGKIGLTEADLIEVIKGHKGKRSGLLLDDILQSLRGMSGKEEFEDDVCLVVLSFNKFLPL